MVRYVFLLRYWNHHGDEEVLEVYENEAAASRHFGKICAKEGLTERDDIGGEDDFPHVLDRRHDRMCQKYVELRRTQLRGCILR